MSRTLSRLQLIERSINKKFRQTLWNPFIAAIKRYELIAPGDRIAVCISGGKDSMLMEKLSSRLLFHWCIPANTSTTTFRESLIREESRKMHRKVRIRMPQPFTPKFALIREMSSFCFVLMV